MNLFLRILVISLIIIVSDIYFYRLLKGVFFSDKRIVKALKIVSIIFPFCFILFEIGVYLFIGFPEDDLIKYRQLFLVLDAFILVYLPKFIASLVLFINDIYKISFRLISRLYGKKHHPSIHKSVNIIAAAMFFITLTYTIYGFVIEKSNFNIQKVDLTFNNLPESFDGFKIVQISDLHLGSYKDTASFGYATKLIDRVRPDILFITGDIINVTYKELLPYENFFRSIDPPYGIISILGNHDIGDYFSIKHPINQDQLTMQLIKTEKEFGFTLLIDSSCYIKKGYDSIAVLGVNNYGKFPFKQHSNLKKAMQNTRDTDFKILLSHNPQHWHKEVVQQTNIDLTLSGHTHAMQMAMICGNFKISPSWFIYRNWYGLYTEAQQFLYVNPGLGYSGFSGRIGTRPEITLITLHCSK